MTASPSKKGQETVGKVDWRSKAARRSRDLFRSYALELGGEAGLSTPQRAMIRQCVAVQLESEAMHDDIIGGRPVKTSEVVRITNALNRCLRELGLQTAAEKAKAKPTRTLKDVIRDHDARAAG